MHRHSIFAAALAMLLFGAINTTQAQDIKFVSQTDFASMQDRIDELEGRLASYSNLGGGAQKGDVCGSCQKGKGDCGCGPSTYATYEMTILQPYISDLAAGPGFADDYGVGHRFTIGRDGGEGMGLRARYWMFNHGKAAVGGLAPLNTSIDMDALDLEATLDQQLCNWDILVSGGIRYGRAEISPAANVFRFEGLGPTVSLEAARCIGDRGLYLVGNARAALLFGEVFQIGAGPTSTIDDELTTVLENQLGIGYRRELGRADLNVRAVWESQFWLNEAGTAIAGSNLGFTGPTFSVEARF